MDRASHDVGDGGWILDGDDELGWVLYLDWKGDGDLSAATPQRLNEVDGRRRLEVEGSDGEARWPVRFTLTREHLGFFDREMKWTVEPGEFRIRVSNSSVGGLTGRLDVR